MPDYSDFEYHRAQRYFYRTARNLALTAVVIAPWLFGSSEPWAYLFVSILSLCSAGMLLFAKVCFPERHIVARTLSFSLIILFLLIFVQVIPLPGFLIRELNPPAYEARSVRDALFQQMEVNGILKEMTGRCDWGCISAVPMATRRALLLFGAYLSIFFVFVTAVRSWAHVERISRAIIFSSFLMVVLSLLHKFSGDEPTKIFWFHVTRYGGDVFGPFTNKNHFAFHVIMVLGMTMGLFCASLPSGRKDWMKDWREKMAWISSKQACGLIFLGFASMLFGATVFFTLSRGAVVSLLTGFGVVWFIFSLSGDRLSGGMIFFAMILCSVVFVAWIGLGPVLARLGSIPDILRDPLSDTRMLITRDTILIAKDASVFGCGLGCFKHVFPMHQSMLLGDNILLHAHNDWVQFLAEVGVLGCGAFLAVVILFFRTIAKNYPDAIERARRYVMGLMIGIIAVMLHSFLDYSLHKPANAFLLSALCGMAVAVVHMSAVLDVPQGPHHPPAGKSFIERWDFKTRIIPFIVLVMLSAVIFMSFSCLRRSVGFERFDYARRLIDKLESSEVIDVTVRSALREVNLVVKGQTCCPMMLREIASDLVRWSLNENIDLELRARIVDDALLTAALSVYHAPMDYLGWLELGRAQMILGNADSADLCLKRARELRPYGANVNLFEYQR